MTHPLRPQIGLSVLLLVGSSLAFGQTSLTAKRDKALQGIQACLHRNEASSRECKHMNQDVASLVDVYKSGDKSVLPTLLRFTYLHDFYDEALLSDRDGFLGAMAQLTAKEQQAVATGVAGAMVVRLDADRFKAIRDSLAIVPEDSPTKAAADLTLKTVETQNAALIVNYFPPGTFESKAANFRLGWFSSSLYQLGEKPLWPPSPEDAPTFRFTYLGAFTGPRTLTLTVSSDGSGKLNMKTSHGSTDPAKIEQMISVPASGTSEFLERLDRARFWNLPIEDSHIGFDGAEWMLEAVQSGKYHIVVRWCPNLPDNSSEDAAFGDATRYLFQLAGEKHKGGC